MANCKTCIANPCVMPYSKGASGAWVCDGYTPPKPTNADRIRSMSDEELAVWLVDATVCERVCNEDEYCHGNECIERVTNWLKQPAKEE